MKILDSLDVDRSLKNIIGESGRTVYSLDKNHVVKYAPQHHLLENIREAAIWNVSHASFLNPSVAITKDGSFLVAKKCKVYPCGFYGSRKRRLYELKAVRGYRSIMPKMESSKYIIDDLHHGNIGFRNGKAFIIDYARFWVRGADVESVEKTYQIILNFSKKLSPEVYEKVKHRLGYT